MFSIRRNKYIKDLDTKARNSTKNPKVLAIQHICITIESELWSFVFYLNRSLTCWLVFFTEFLYPSHLPCNNVVDKALLCISNDAFGFVIIHQRPFSFIVCRYRVREFLVSKISNIVSTSISDVSCTHDGNCITYMYRVLNLIIGLWMLSSTYICCGLKAIKIVK